MKLRSTPEVFCKATLTLRGENVGYLQLVEYTKQGGKPHIEFYVDEPYRGCGIMRKELPKYLADCKKYGYTQLIGVVKHDNAPSIRLLESNGFVRITDIGDNRCYIVDLNLEPWVVQGIVEKIQFLTKKEKQ